MRTHTSSLTCLPLQPLTLSLPHSPTLLPAIADVLFGRVNPSAKSPFTWPVDLQDCPSYGNFPRDANLQIRYSEGVHMGWRGYDRKGAKQPAFGEWEAVEGTRPETSPAPIRLTCLCPSFLPSSLWPRTLLHHLRNDRAAHLW